MRASLFIVVCFGLLVSFLVMSCIEKSSVVSQNLESIPNEQYENVAQKFADEAQFKSSNYYLKKAIEFYQRHGLWKKVISCHIKIGNNFQQIGSHKKALEHFSQALNLALNHSEYQYTDLVKHFQKMAFKHFNNKEYDLAIDYYNKALSLQLKVFNENHLDVAKIYNSLALVYWNKGNELKAVEYYNKSLSIKLRGFNPTTVEMGKKYAFFNPRKVKKKGYVEIKNHLKKSLKIYLETFGDIHPLVASLYENIGILYGFEGSFEQAMIYFRKSLAIRLDVFGDESLETANNYHFIGVCLLLKEDFGEALRFLQEALRIKHLWLKKDHVFTADTNYQLGKIFFIQKKFDKALEYYQQSLIALVPTFSNSNIYSNPGLKHSYLRDELIEVLSDKAETLWIRYSFNPHQIDDLKFSFETYWLATEVIDKIRNLYKSEEYKLIFGERFHQLYNNAIQATLTLYDLTNEIKYKNAAFSFSEKCKAALLFQALSESEAKEFSGIPEKLLKAELKLKKELAFYTTYLEKEFQKKRKADKKKIEQLENRYFELKNEHQKLVEHFEKNYEKYFRLKYQNTSISIRKLQKSLNQKTALVEYFVGKGIVNIFILTRENFKVVSRYTGSEFNRMVESYYQSIKKIEDKSFLYLSTKLYQILIKPILTWVKNKKKLIIIPHEYLYYIPFETLVSGRGEEESFFKINYLIKQFSISYHYSANLWYYRKQSVEKNKNKSFIGFAPVFGEKNKKGYILSSENSNNDVSRHISRIITVEGKRLPELEASEKELRSIINLFKKYSKKATGYFFQQASESNFKRADMKNYDYLHIATHSLSDKIYPKLSGLFFSDPDDPVSLEDGILYSEETFNLSLDTELIVLSSCESGIGKLVKGEGMIALNRGFFYAGAKNIIFSLWKVEDKATSRLMIELYRNILRGKSITDSLRYAKLRLIKDKFTAFPKYWSGFILVGN